MVLVNETTLREITHIWNYRTGQNAYEENSIFLLGNCAARITRQ